MIRVESWRIRASSRLEFAAIEGDWKGHLH